MVGLYNRVSTTKQDAENQAVQLREFCKKSGWTIHKEYTDIISGGEDSRPEWDQLFRDAHKKLFDMVLFWSYDRFSRSGATFTLMKLKELQNLNIIYKSYQEQYIDSGGIFKEAIISIVACVAKAEKERISERTKAAFYIDENGITRSRKTGKAVGKRGKDTKVRKWRSDKGIKRGV